MFRPTLIASLLCATALLSGCGGGGSGGGGSVASAPAPLTTAPPAPAREALPPTPATTSGTYTAIATFVTTDSTNSEKLTLPDGRVVYAQGAIVALNQIAPVGSVTLSVDADTRTYTLTATAGPIQFPSDSMTMAAGSDLGYTRNNPITSGSPEELTPLARAQRGDLVAHTLQAGTSAAGLPRLQTSYVSLHNVGQMNGSPRYISFAEWGQFYQESPDGMPGSSNNRLLQRVGGTMLFGQRTASGDLPQSGKATYELHSYLQPAYRDEDGNRHDPFGDGALDIDFATRTLGARYSWEQGNDIYKTDDEGYPLSGEDGEPIVLGHATATIQTTGSTQVGNDSGFLLALSGTGTYQRTEEGKPPSAATVTPVTGSLTGAFFGPQAAEVGGFADLPRIDAGGGHYQTLIDFIGTQAP
ncbi:MAG TPA: hypothetical protein VJM34_01970 [Novosphingobium sp.]|nr:hypothetical protein [Novosphingobium sp.]